MTWRSRAQSFFLQEGDGMWELVTGKPGIRIMWRNEDDALCDLTIEGWKIEGPFRMSPKKRRFRNLWFTGYGLTRCVH